MIYIQLIIFYNLSEVEIHSTQFPSVLDPQQSSYHIQSTQQQMQICQQ